MTKQSIIEDILLDFAQAFQEMTTSDAQSVASVEAQKIINFLTK